jgi:diguanylate cyclase (GGDEF)-like protein
MQVLPFHLVLNSQLELQQVGPSLQRCYPSVKPGCLLEDCLQIERPAIAPEFEAILQQQDTFFVLEIRGTGVKLRGQMIYDALQNLLFFLGSPWVTSFADLRSAGLEISDFAILDPISDFLVLSQTQHTALKDTQRLAEKLTQQRTELRHALSLLQATLESTADGILVVSKSGKVETLNQKFVEMWELPQELAVLKQDQQDLMYWISTQLLNPEDFLQTVQIINAERETINHELLLCNDGRVFEAVAQPQWLNQEIVGRVWSFRDVTNRHQQERTIRYQATHDLLTGLPNRLLFGERLSIAMTQAACNQTKLAVMFLDLDRFKWVNDTFGHGVGDHLLQTISKRMATCLRESDMIARWAGDEFTLLLPNIQTAQDGVLIAQRLLEAIKPPIALEGQTLRVTTSIGIALYPDDGTTVDTLLKHADAALYRAKASGRNMYHLFTAEMLTEQTNKLQLGSRLHQALERQEFMLCYQPRINVNTGAVTHLEALIRWQHPDLGLIPPGRFIPLAEETGLIVTLGEWVLRTACQQNQRWQQMGLPPVKVAVNLSAYQLKQPTLVEQVRSILQEASLPPTALELEITETVLMDNTAIAKTTLTRLNQMGISIAMDDFGTGYSSLSYLKEFPFQVLKIDRSFVQDVTTNLHNKALVNAIIAMGSVLNLMLVAEGVETEEQELLLRSLGCEEMQGFRFSPPLTVEETTALLQRLS